MIVKLISIEKKKNVILQNGVKVSCDEILAKENLSKYNVIYLPGGKGHERFNELLAPKLVTFIKKNAKNPAITLMAMCAATECFYQYGILTDDIKVTTYPGVQTGKFEKNYVKQDVVISKNYITAAGPGIAHEFGFKIVEKFVSPAIAREIRKSMLYK
jgi:putative intracellular protease/amidase